MNHGPNDHEIHAAYRRVIASLHKSQKATKKEFDDFRQKVSDIASVYNKMAFTVTETEPHLSNYRVIIGFDKIADASMCHDRLVSLLDFLNPKQKPDPLVAAMKAAGWGDAYINNSEPSLRAALDALGFEIREKNDD